MSLEANLVKFIKEIIVELACNNFIDHRDYDRLMRESNLKNKMIQNNYNFEVSINQIVKEIFVNKKIMNQIKFFINKNIIDMKAQPKNENNNNFEETISEFSKCTKYTYKINYDEEYNVEDLEDDDDEDEYYEDIDEDEEYELKNNLFDNFIRYVGLNEILTLHSDDIIHFQDKFFKAICN
jgi:hypothetical protein